MTNINKPIGAEASRGEPLTEGEVRALVDYARRWGFLPKDQAVTADERRLLELLAESPNGATDALLLAQGFTLDVLAELIARRAAGWWTCAGSRGCGGAAAILPRLSDIARDPQRHCCSPEPR
jgi:hypothetical protein